MKAETHPKYLDAEIRCACGNVIKTRSTRPTILVGIPDRIEKLVIDRLRQDRR